MKYKIRTILLTLVSKDEKWAILFSQYLIKIQGIGAINVITDEFPEGLIEDQDNILVALISDDYLESDFGKKILNLFNKKILILIKECSSENKKLISNETIIPNDGRTLSSYPENEMPSFWKSFLDLINTFNFTKTKTSLNAPTISIRGKNHDPVIGVKELAEEIAYIISNQEGEDPTLIGLFGQWGRGKTFLMEQIWKQLSPKDKPNFEQVQFHAWKYQDTPASWAYLYEEFSEEYFKMPQKNADDHSIHFLYPVEYIRAKIIRLYRIFKLNKRVHGWLPLFLLASSIIGSLIWFSSLQYCFPKLITIIIPAQIIVAACSALLKIYHNHKNSAFVLLKKYTKKKNFNELLGCQKEIQNELRILLESWCPNKKPSKVKKILLFVDDLDRCSEDRLIQIIDSLRVMLEDKDIAKRVIAIVAVDERILIRAINCKYQRIINYSDGIKELEISRLTQEYLDKLFLLGIKLNPLTQKEKEEIFQTIAQNTFWHQRVRINPQEEKRSNSTDLEIEIKNGHNKPTSTPTGIEKIYKIPKSLLKDKRIKRLPKDVSQILNEEAGKQYSEEEISNFLSDNGIGGDIFKLILEKSEFRYEIEEDEYNQISKSLHLFENATPRSIRIFYYQYVLAKRLLKKYPEYHSLLVKVINESRGINPLLDFLLLMHLFRSYEDRKLLYECLNNKELYKIHRIGRKISPEEKELINRIAVLDIDLLEKLKSVVETVVAY